MKRSNSDALRKQALELLSELTVSVPAVAEECTKRQIIDELIIDLRQNISLLQTKPSELIVYLKAIMKFTKM